MTEQNKTAGDANHTPGQRWLAGTAAITIPPFSLVQGAGGTKGEGLSLIKPVLADLNHYGASGATEIATGKRGEVTWDYPFWIKYTGGAPSANDIVGPGAASFTVSTSGTGYKVIQVDAGSSLVWIIPFREGGGICPECDCQNALSFEECWNFGWLQDLNDLNQIGGGFDILIKWEMTDAGGTVLTSCDDIIERANCEASCDFGWKLTQAGESSQTMESHPFTGNGNDSAAIYSPSVYCFFLKNT